MERFEAHPVPVADRVVAAEPGLHAAQGGGRYFRYEVRPDDRRTLLDDWRRMAQASQAQERIRDNGFLRDNED